jgi:hypothetical protein
MSIKDMQPTIKDDGSRILPNTYTYRQPSSHNVKRIVRNTSQDINRNAVLSTQNTDIEGHTAKANVNPNLNANVNYAYNTVAQAKNKSKLLDM